MRPTPCELIRSLKNTHHRRGQEKLRVLIVDDSKDIRERLVKLCELVPDVEVIGQAADGCAGLQAIRELEPDLVTLDLGMPKMTGIEVLQVLKARENKSQIIVLSSFTESVYQKCYELGATHVLDKTKDIDLLLKLLREA
jgi:YesN/AraC family two-component response regulator